MIGLDEVGEAFNRIAPDIMGNSSGPEESLRKNGVDPDAIAPMGNTLATMFATTNTPPEDAVPAAFSIGVLLGLALRDATPA